MKPDIFHISQSKSLSWQFLALFITEITLAQKVPNSELVEQVTTTADKKRQHRLAELAAAELESKTNRERMTLPHQVRDQEAKN